MCITPDPAKTILVDMDGVIADFEGGFRAEWRKRYPQRRQLDTADRECFRIYDAFDRAYKEDILEIYRSPGFCLGLSPINGAIAALNEMLASGWDVFICTSPITRSPYSMAEKHAWIENHLGNAWVERLILAKFKQLVRGRFLIDDNPELTSVRGAEWQLLLFDQFYNRRFPYPLRLSWDNWEIVLPDLELRHVQSGRILAASKSNP